MKNTMKNKIRNNGTKIRITGKRSQTEIIGLVIIVMLVVVGFMLYVRFSLLAPKDSTKNDFTKAELATNTVNVMMKTTTDCRDATVQDLLKDCATEGRISCYSSPSGVGSTLRSCEYAQAAIKAMADSTLERWSRGYTILFYRADQSVQFNISDSGNSCVGNRNYKSAFSYIPLNPGTATLKIQLCDP